MARDAGRCHLESDELAAHTRTLLLVKRSLADEVVFFPADDPPQIGFEDRGRLVDVLTGQVHSRLEAQRVSRAKADGHDTNFGARLEDRIPHALGRRRRNEELEPILAGVAGSGDDASHAGHFAVCKPVVLDRRKINGCELLNDPGRFRTLHGEQRIARARIDDGDIAHRPRVLADPFVGLL